MGQLEGKTNPDGTPVKVSTFKPNRANQAAGGILLLLLAGVMWIYGFAGQIRNATTKNYPTTGLAGTINTQTVIGNLYVVGSIFVVIGFGLLLTFFKRGTFSALFTSILVASLTTVVSPILQKFWFNVFITNFQGATPTPTDPSRFLQYSLGGTGIFVDYYNLRIVLANTIAQLVSALALFGRMNPGQIIINSIGFNFCWNLNYFLCALLALRSPDSRIVDDYQITSIYLFAACYGLVASLILRPPASDNTPEFGSTSNSTVTAHLGTFFLFLAFCTTSPLLMAKYSVNSVNAETERALIRQEAFISTFLALSASVIANYACSVLINRKGKLGVKGSLVGTITGAIIYGSVASTCVNIGAAIACGVFAGLASAVFFERVLPNLNRGWVRDSLGLLGILVVSLLGTLLIAPTVIKAYYNYSVDLPTLYPQNSPTSRYSISNADSAGWALVYVGVSMGVGLVAGLLAGLLMKAIERPAYKYFDDAETFRGGSYGLREPLAAPEGGLAVSAQDLNG